jgi:poly-gamma-glutamate capsule biosynthesis protein CapA/YwtB (metallophosphatase superfamily)
VAAARWPARPAHRALTARAAAVAAVGGLLVSGCSGDGVAAPERAASASTRANGEPVTSPPGTAPPAEPTDATGPPGQRRSPRVTVTVVGDIMLGRRVAEAASAAGGPAAPLRVMAERLARADVTVGNLESTLSEAGPPRQGDDSFAAPPSVLHGLARAGFDVLSLANNHTGDFGRRALRQTVRAFSGTRIAPVGAGLDRRAAWRPVVVERREVRIGFLAFNAIGETWRAGRHSAGAAGLHMQPRTGSIVPAELGRLADRVRRLAARTDVTIVLPHWGEQYTHEPVPDQRRVGARLLRAGATVVVGGHPHWVQAVQRQHGRFVVHSLGNFVFDMDFMQQTQEGFVLDLTFRDGRLVATRPTPYVIGADFTPRPAGGGRGRAILDDVAGLDLLPSR